jgi:hypothetical protein
MEVAFISFMTAVLVPPFLFKLFNYLFGGDPTRFKNLRWAANLGYYITR